MRQKTQTRQTAADKTIKDIRRATRSVMLQSEVQGLLDGGALLLFRDFLSALPNEDRCE